MTTSHTYDIMVLGSGPGGYVAAIRAAQLGFNVAVVERENLGGICLNWGCIPTKALLKAGEVLETINHAEEFGISVKSAPQVDFTKLVARSRKVADKLSKGIAYLMKKHNIDVITGSGAFTAQNTLTVTNGKKDTAYTFKNAIIATGARARTIPNLLQESEHVWTYRKAMTPEKLPKTMLVIGSGAIGVEFASFYNALGVDVTIVEAQKRIVPAEDEEIAKRLHKALENQGITIVTEAQVSGLASTKSAAEATINGDVKTYDKAILAIGIQGNVENLGLDLLGIKVEKGQIVHNDMYQTTQPHIYAIGDVAGAPWLAHVASHEGIIAAEHIGQIAGKGTRPHAFNYTVISGCTYCHPQVASVGYTEEAAKAAGYKVKVGRFDYQANGKAIAIGEASGLVKTIFESQTGELLGAHIIGADATEMISTFVLGRSMEATEQDFLTACLPHPTLSEMMAESVLDSLGRVINA